MLFSVLLIFLSCIIALWICIYSYRQIQRNGFNCCTTFLMVMILFYIAIPLLYVVFQDRRDASTAFNRLLSTKSLDDIAINMFLASAFIALILFFYHCSVKHRGIILYRRFGKKNTTDSQTWDKINGIAKIKIERISDITLILGGISIIVCIFAVGGISRYLALGSQTRGLNKNLSDYISSSFLPLITLSNIILAPPFLYKYLLGIKLHVKRKSTFLKVKFLVSFCLAVIYLLYNQGRLPLLLFFVPFLLDMKIARKAKIGTLIVLSILCIFALEPLSNLFIYLSYGRVVSTQGAGLLNTLLLEFTYPFSNFVNRSELLKYVGMRWGIDYIQWPLTVLPSSILKLVGFSKSSIETIGSLNTNAYSTIVRVVGGGIPTDFFTFNYYQFGMASLLIALPVVAFVLKIIDSRISNVADNAAAKILILRVCFLLISMVNNFDFSVIFRMRFDFLIIVWAIFYIAKNKKEECTNES